MTARELLHRKFRETETNASILDMGFVITFWNGPEDLGNMLECEVAYFSNPFETNRYFDYQKNVRQSVGLPYHILSSHDSAYNEKFCKEIDREVTQFNWDSVMTNHNIPVTEIN